MVRDINGREIKVNDLIRTPHFIHYRRKKQMYLYHVVGEKNGELWMFPAKWAFGGDDGKGGSCRLMDGSARPEIIDGCGNGGGCDYWYDRQIVIGDNNNADDGGKEGEG